jgi:hypothetical protein
MRKIITVLFILISGFVFSEEVKPVDKIINFRSTKWGMSKKEVIQSEKIKLTIVKDDVFNDDSLEGELKIDNFNMGVAYLFVDDKFCAGGYTTIEKNLTGEEYFKIYYQIKKILIEKYGNPVKEDEKINKVPDEQKYLLLSLGKIEFTSSWNFNNVFIVLTMARSNNFPGVGVLYIHEELMKRKQKKQNEINSKNF